VTASHKANATKLDEMIDADHRCSVATAGSDGRKLKKQFCDDEVEVDCTGNVTALRDEIAPPRARGARPVLAGPALPNIMEVTTRGGAGRHAALKPEAVNVAHHQR
jgi:hypothetical protein